MDIPVERSGNMQTITGKDVMSLMLELAQDMQRWNKINMSEHGIAAYLEEVGLTKHQMELLGFLYGNPETNTVSRIASELLISKGSLSLMLTKLEKQGFVEKTAPDGNDDGRKVYISLTENGRKAIENMMEVLLKKGGHVFDAMSQEKRLLFYRKLEELKAIFNLGGWEK